MAFRSMYGRIKFGKMYAKFSMILLHVTVLTSLWIGVKADSRVSTSPRVTGIRGDPVSLPCNPTGSSGVRDVFWHHLSPGLGEDKTIVARYFNRKCESAVAGYNITRKFSLLIARTDVEHDGNYSCTVAFDDLTDNRNVTLLSVVALANPLEPKVANCKPSSPDIPGRCDYVFPDVDDATVKFELLCQLKFVRPLVDIWWSSFLVDHLTTSSVYAEEGGLYNITVTHQVSKSQVGDIFVCIANGEAVGGQSSVVVSLKELPSPRQGLSGGAIFGIRHFVIIILIAALTIEVWYWRRRNPPVPPNQIECETLRQDILDYRPGSLSALQDREGRQLPSKARIAAFGVTSAGKSSLVRSFRHAVKGDFIEVEIAKTQTAGGVTIKPTPYAITDYVSVVDNRGLRDLDEKQIPQIMKQIQGNDNDLHPGECIDCPIFVFDARQPLNSLDIFLPAFIEAVRKEYHTHPVVVVTHREEVREKLAAITPKVTGLGALEQRLFFVENFTEEPNEPDYDRNIDFLKILKNLLKLADQNMITRADKGDRDVTRPTASKPLLV